MKASDYFCSRCAALFQLKSSGRPFVGHIQDAAYSAMIAAIREDRTPNLIALRYDPIEWRVRDLFLIPHFALSESAIRCRKPLSPSAERRGWIGCVILLAQIPKSARIPLISDGLPSRPRTVREQYAKLQPLSEIPVELRGWTLDVYNVVQALGRNEFGLSEVYAHRDQLARLHPKNRHVDEKIRQQLQVLRDAKLLSFLGPGRYRLR